MTKMPGTRYYKGGIISVRIQKYLGKCIRVITDQDYRFLIFDHFGFFRWMPDKAFLKRKFRAKTGQKLNLENPQTFNEKLQWLKLYNQNSKYTIMVDKYLVRDYIARTIGEQYLIPLIAVWDKPTQIDFSSMPNQFVLKCNHNSG